MPERVAFVTYADLPDCTDDDRLAIECLRDKGVMAEPVVWDENRVDWSAFSSIVLRSCWDYHRKPVQFARWVRERASQGTTLWNSPDLLLWNMDKRYLLDLAARGITIPPSAYLEEGRPADLASLMESNGWEKAVIKPAISASADRTWLVSLDNAEVMQPELDEMLAAGAVVAQQYMSEIEAGEWSLVFLGGEYSHAVLKRPGAGDFRVQEHYGGSWTAANPGDELVKQAGAVLAAIDAPILYARVDAIEIAGNLTLMELELIEPYLFLREGAAAARFASCIMSTLQ